MLTIIEEHPLARHSAGELKSHIGTIFVGQRVLITLPGMNHVEQRYFYRDCLNVLRRREGLPVLTPLENIEIWDNAIDLLMQDQYVLIRPESRNIDLAFEADECLQEILSKSHIRFLPSSNPLVQQAMGARGEYKRVGRPRTFEDICDDIVRSRTGINGLPIYYYSQATGSRILTVQALASLGDKDDVALRKHLLEIRDFSAMRNRFGHREIAFFASDGTFCDKSFSSLDLENASALQLRAWHAALTEAFRAAVDPALHADQLRNPVWRNSMYACLTDTSQCYFDRPLPEWFIHNLMYSSRSRAGHEMLVIKMLDRLHQPAIKYKQAAAENFDAPVPETQEHIDVPFDGSGQLLCRKLATTTLGVEGQNNGQDIDVRSTTKGLLDTHLESKKVSHVQKEQIEEDNFEKEPQVGEATSHVAETGSRSDDPRMCARGDADITIFRDESCIRQTTPFASGSSLWSRIGDCVKRGVLLGRGDLRAERVDCTVYAPPRVPRGRVLLVQVFAHRPDQTAEAKEMAKTFDEQSAWRGFKSLESVLKRGERLAFTLEFGSLHVVDSVQYLTWQGRPESVQFDVEIPSDFKEATAVGKVTVSRDGVPLGRILFKVGVLPAVGSQLASAAPLGDSAITYKMAFVSYASEDRDEVLKRIQMLDVFKMSYFCDKMHLRSGDQWETKLYEHIDKADLFLLFWSEAAKNSRWVVKETEYALSRKGEDPKALPEIVPVLLKRHPPVLPPPSLAHIQFDSPILYFLSR